MAFKYGSSAQPITITLASLGSASGRQSTAIDNSGLLYDDVLVFLQIKTGSGVSANGYATVYAIGTSDAGSTFTDGATGTDGSFTQVNAPAIGNIIANASTTIYYGGPFSIARGFGGILPAKWAIAVVNSTGATLDSTAGNFLAEYQGVNF